MNTPFISRFFRITVLTVTSLVLVASAAGAADWKADPNHSKVGFSINHFLTPVEGRFGEFEAQIAYDPAKPEATTIKATIQVASIDTGNDRRDGHLESADFFEAEKYPTITFESTSVEAAGEGHLVAHGNLTMKGQTKPVDLHVNVLGVQAIPEQMQEHFGKELAAFSAKTSLDRTDFGVGVGNWAATLVVGAKVDISITIEASHQ